MTEKDGAAQVSAKAQMSRGLQAFRRIAKPSFMMRRRGLAYSVHHVPGMGYRRTEKVIALTFDDGPHPTFTPEILDVLRHYDTPATFFMTGDRASADPDLVVDVAKAGHTIGCHTWDHANVTLLDEDGLDREIGRTNRLLFELTGAEIRLVRPPEGRIDGPSLARLHRRGLTTVLWTVGSKDWQRPGSSVIADRVIDLVHRNAIVGLHDTADHTPEALPLILEGLQARGYRSVALGPALPPQEVTLPR